MSQNMIVFTMTKTQGKGPQKLFVQFRQVLKKKDLLTESALEAVATDRDIVNATTEQIRYSSMNY